MNADFIYGWHGLGQALNRPADSVRNSLLLNRLPLTKYKHGRRNVCFARAEVEQYLNTLTPRKA